MTNVNGFIVLRAQTNCGQNNILESKFETKLFSTRKYYFLRNTHRIVPHLPSIMILHSIEFAAGVKHNTNEGYYAHGTEYRTTKKVEVELIYWKLTEYLGGR